MQRFWTSQLQHFSPPILVTRLLRCCRCLLRVNRKLILICMKRRFFFHLGNFALGTCWILEAQAVLKTLAILKFQKLASISRVKTYKPQDWTVVFLVFCELGCLFADTSLPSLASASRCQEKQTLCLPLWEVLSALSSRPDSETNAMEI